MTRRELRVSGLPEPISHYADAVLADGVLVGAGDVVAQARRVFELLARVLAAAGAGPGDVAKVTVFLVDVDDRPRINPVRQEFFGSSRPASTLVEVFRLAVPGALLEVEAVAHVGP